MFRPSIQKVRFLFLIALISILLFYIIEKTVFFQKHDDYLLKVEAATKMEEALEILKDTLGRDYEWFDRDPFDTRLVFYGYSPLLTDIGKYQAKATVLKPNFAALVIDEFTKAGLEQGDSIAISMTGSMPGANIAVLMACEAMKLNYVSISSLGASEWGALDLNASWPKMEKILYENGLISSVSKKFTYGGGGDYLKQGSDSRSDYGGLSKRNTIDSVMMDIYPEKSLSDLFLVQNLSSSNEAFASDINNPLDINREYYALSVNISRRLDTYDKGNNSVFNKQLFSEIINDYIYIDENGDSVIYLDNITIINSKKDTTLTKKFNDDFDLIEQDLELYENECVQPSRDRDKVGSISPEALSALLYICDESNLKCLEPVYYEKDIDAQANKNLIPYIDSIHYYRDVNCNQLQDKRKEFKLIKLGQKYREKIRNNISDNYNLSNYKAYINVGGNVASFGYNNKEKFEKKKGYGFLEHYKVKDILEYNPDDKTLRRGVINHFVDLKIPIINFIEIEKMIKNKDLKYFDRRLTIQQINDGLDVNQDGMIDIAKGNLYEDKKYNLLIVWISLIISLGSIFYIGLTSYRQINNQMKDYNPND